MVTRFRPALALGLVLASLSIAAAPALAKGEGKSKKETTRKVGRFRVMSFNIRFDFPNDGPNRWSHRAATVAKVIRESEAIIVGLQEDKIEQVEDLKQLLPEYEFLGPRGRNGSSGERCAIAVRTDLVRVKETGEFWLSDTPEVVGSNTWGDRYPRKVTWGLLEVKGNKSKVLALNLHLPERDSGPDVANRVRGARLLNEFIAGKVPAKERSKVAVVVTGDFNSTPDEEPRKALCDDLPLRDAWQDAGARHERSPGTYGAFNGARGNDRIDWILLGGPLRAHAYVKIDEQVDGRWPSDHYPIIAEVELR